MNVSFGRALLIAACLATATPAVAQLATPAGENNGFPSRSAQAKATGRIIVKWRKQGRDLSSGARAQKASAIAGLKLNPSVVNNDQDVLLFEGAIDNGQIERAAEKLATSEDVEFASPEYRRKPHALTNDPLLTQQWYLLSTEVSATRSDAAWDITQGSPSVVVAVLDTGVRFDHPDLSTKVTNGYDFVSHALVANDGDGRDADASDPGDWVSLSDSQQNPNVFDEDCLSDSGGPVNSSWHGTRVSGLVAAHTNNAQGVAGNAWNTQVLGVRVLGKCGGTDHDIMDAMRWAAGIPVTGVPTNPTPAHVINLSLGGEGACTSAYQATVNEIIARGVLIVVSAGNEGTAVSAPANCNGVLGVAGLRHAGTKVGFSNLGPQVGIGAPGGNCVNTIGPCLYPIVVATNMGTTTPSTNSYSLNVNVGTSFSAPMAASAAALLRAVNNSLTPAQSILLLKDSATPFPVDPAVRTCTVPSATSAPQDLECNCTTATCGAGMLNTAAAVAAAQKPLAVLQMSGSVIPGATLNLNGASSFAAQGRTLAAHQWSISNVTGTAPTITNTSQAVTTLHISAEAQFTLRLTVTDDQGAQGAKEIALAASAPVPPPAPTPTPTAPPAPAPMSGGGGGGGQLGWEVLVIGLFGLLRIGSRSRSNRKKGTQKRTQLVDCNG